MFENLRSCLQHSYAKTSASAAGHETSSFVDWEKTSASDMLDLMAAKLAFQAFNEWMQKEGLNFYFARAQQFNQRQLFFIYYGLNFCENVNPAIPRGDDDAPSPAWEPRQRSASAHERIRRCLSVRRGFLHESREEVQPVKTNVAQGFGFRDYNSFSRCKNTDVTYVILYICGHDTPCAHLHYTRLL
ncbi:hypothetical protein HPB48_013310 [Haemaphysalis longicornis]|uniref:Uncharacterized protein n=1 Tax=Haemaphysalis longicornis TaxID=44386 RepID=A0A9J6GPV5_HAELO|nr:hypothetical protein HPB48_013310 [Haemaphysalis longicornis]